MFISSHMGPTQNLKVEYIRPTVDNFYSFSWKTLDILLFSWYMLHGSGNIRTLFLELWVPPKLRDRQQVAKEATKDKENPWLHSFFPLNNAVGKGMWLGDCSEALGEYWFVLDFQITPWCALNMHALTQVRGETISSTYDPCEARSPHALTFRNILSLFWDSMTSHLLCGSTSHD